MSKKERKEALEFILNNDVIVRKLSIAIGCDKASSMKERRVLVKDMIKSYREENVTDSFSVNMFGPGKKHLSGIFINKHDYDDDFDDVDDVRNDILSRLRGK